MLRRAEVLNMIFTWGLEVTNGIWIYTVQAVDLLQIAKQPNMTHLCGSVYNDNLMYLHFFVYPG